MTESFLRSWQYLSWSKNSLPFMEGSLPCSQQPDTWPCLKPHKSSQHPVSL